MMLPRAVNFHLRKCLARVLARAGLHLSSRRAHNHILATRAAAVAELTALEEKSFKPGLTVLVFSFNRAMQLHATLASYFAHAQNPAPVTVQYAAATPAHAKAYAEVEKLFPKVAFVKETNFRQTLHAILAGVATRNLLFLTDDIVFIRPLNLALAAKIDASAYVYSLRLGPHLRRSYTMDVAQNPPAFRPSTLGDDLLEFTWGEQSNEWAYPYSVDGHVLPTAEVRVLARLAPYKAPNSFEGALHQFADIAMSRPGLCHTHAKLLNLPLNKVQTEIANRAAAISPEWLLSQWQAGMRLDTAHLSAHTPQSPHEEHPLRLLPREKAKQL